MQVSGAWQRFPLTPIILFLLVASMLMAPAEKQTAAASNQEVSAAPVLRPGSQGESVRRLQEALNAISPARLKIDGIYGPKTTAAVKAFQASHNLAVDGITGPKTWAAITSQLAQINQYRHVVQRGDTLSKIARTYGVSLQELIRANNLVNPDLLSIGTELVIPGASQTGRSAPASTRQLSPASEPAAASPINSAAPIALTFNNIPSEETARSLLELLQSHGVTATFFITGKQALENQELVRRIAEAGHDVENYGWDKQRPSRGTASSLLTLQLRRAQQVLYEATGKRPRFYRPAYADTGAAVMQAAAWAGLGIILWTNVGSEDRPGVPAGDLVRWLSGAVYPGAIIMLHADNPEAVAALEQLIPVWKQKGAQFLTLDQLLSRGAVWPSFSDNRSE